jgi:[DsrC]-trisulfide reductase subunit J
MHEKGLVAGGLLVFVGLLTYPVWQGRVAGTTSQPPTLQRPPAGQRCVLPAGEMRERHMALLTEWRDAVVREQVRTYTAPDGRRFTISLSQTCLGCHTSRTDFCDRCHAYASVTPYCWDCHVDPASVQRSRR